jgi:hypothetical protein
MSGGAQLTVEAPQSATTMAAAAVVVAGERFRECSFGHWN